MISTQKAIHHIVLLRKKPLLLHWNILIFMILYPLASLGINVYLLPAMLHSHSDHSHHHHHHESHSDNLFFYHLVCLGPLALIHLVTFLSAYWNVNIKAFFQYSPVGSDSISEGIVVKVVPNKHKGFTELCPLKLIREENGQQRYYFEYQKRGFYWDENLKQFVRNRFPYQNLEQKSQTLKEWITKTEKQGLTDKETHVKRRIYGHNQFEIPIPKFLELFIEHALAPFFVFQVFCVLLWCLDEYWYYSLFTLVMLFMFESTVVNSRLRSLNQIRQMATKPQFLNVYRDGKWIEISSIDLLPNDIISVTHHAEEGQVTPCDILLISGKCVTNEALLTGESTPQMKECIPVEELKDRKKLDIKNIDKSHVIFGGTVVLQHTTGTACGKQAPDKGAVGIVLRTGFETSQGKLIRTILYASERVSANNVEALLFILFLLIFAIIASAYVLYEGLKNPEKSRYKLALNCILIITSVVPPELPMELSLAVNNSLLSLSMLGIFCTEPFRIPYAGKVNVCCFDKTGTLVSDKMTLKGIAMSENDSDELLEKPSEKSRMVLAGCQSLIDLNGKILGDPMEVSGLSGVEYEINKDIIQSTSSKTIKSIKILKRFPFNSVLKRMSTIVHVVEKNDSKVTRVLVKGAPELVKPFLTGSEVPGALQSYDTRFQHLTQIGMRVITLAYKDLNTTDLNVVEKLTREEVEKDLIFAGFASFQSDIKPNTKETIQNLKNSSHKVIMITGDNPLTASHVAKELEMTNKPILSLKQDNEKYYWFGNTSSGCDSDTHKDFDISTIPTLSKSFDFCVSGEQMANLSALSNGKTILDVLSSHVAIFARVSPEQKESILTSLKSQNYQTLMCGDGTNDVGALKQAHVGVALLENKPQPKKENETQQPNTPLHKKSDIIKELSKVNPSVSPQAQQKKSFTELLKEMKEKQEQLAAQEEANLVKLGDASIASPFTSRKSTIESCAHIIMQGRCTLVTTMQMYKILALNCLISAYSLSALYLDGVKFGDSQMMITGFGVALCFLFISRSKPLDTLSKERPHITIFSPYMLATVMGQFIVHLTTLALSVQAAKLAAPEVLFEPKEADFKPNLLNTIVFIVTSLQTIVTFATNYKGRPFMQGLTENKPLFFILAGIGALCMLCASGLVPELNATMELVDIPEGISVFHTFSFRSFLLVLLFANIGAVLLVEKMCATFFPASDSIDNL
ncbi:cation-transporting ATPase [Naegleria gruberi]|uniref:Cation-transporting ATPase n=1 Tax=Naegleria gruberi TaxID=5762 RepID=D2UXJ4_NAEGR|nr:cation-transporting ATPase [Naegleria gruberi]EFC50295.1 cation-transporting ATPase [Naegleria gruberi]|eukprot:XP_002683039.1 cation-transporting ATPase [Naegleria gruberi strain NEG-M]